MIISWKVGQTMSMGSLELQNKANLKYFLGMPQVFLPHRSTYPTYPYTLVREKLQKGVLATPLSSLHPTTDTPMSDKFK